MKKTPKLSRCLAACAAPLAIAASSATALTAPFTVAEYLPAGTTQSSGIGQDTYVSQTFIPSASGTLRAVGVVVERRNTQTTPDGLTMQIRPAASDNKPTGGIYGEAELPPGVIPTDTGFGDTASQLTYWDFTGESISLTQGQRYAIVLASPDAAEDGDDYGLFASNTLGELPDVQAGLSSDGGQTWGIFGGTNGFLDAPHQVIAIPEPTTLAMLGLGGVTLLGRRRRRSACAVA